MAEITKEEWFHLGRMMQLTDEKLEEGWRQVLKGREEEALKTGKLYLPKTKDESPKE